MKTAKNRSVKHIKRNVIALLLSVIMVFPMLPIGKAVGGSDYQAKKIASDYFYNQLNERAKAIYDKLLSEFTGADKEKYYGGTEFIDLMNLETKDKKVVIGTSDVEAYIKNGNKDIFNDFTAAKDALDLDHSELWYIDSGYLSFRVTQKDGDYHVLIGPGRGDTYLLAGTALDNVKSRAEATEKVIDEIVNNAVDSLNEAQNVAGSKFSEQDQKAALVTSVHDQVVKRIHYRYETECRNKGENAKYIRTIYGAVTHEGVCEAYARTLQVCLTKLGVECVLVHGIQDKGTPEDHMWNVVNIPENGENKWYAVDATWDDPLTANWDGTRDLTFNDGLDGKETNTYLMVGQSTIGEYWHPSGYVSTGNFEFKFPTVETASYSGATAFGSDDGLKVKYSAGGSQEDGVPAGVYTATFKGWNAEEAAKHGFFFMIKMYDYHPDGTSSVMDEWYYANATLLLTVKNPYFGDYEDGLRFSSPTCEYVEIAVTSRKPDHFETWSSDPNTSYLSKDPYAGYFKGDESEIVAQSGMLYNVNSKYEAPPYVLTQTPAPNGNSTAGYDYRFKVTFDDDLYHILPNDRNALQGVAAAASDNFTDNYEQAKLQTVQVRYTTNQQDLHNNGAVITTQVSGELPFDANRDGIVDMNGTYTDFKWIYKSDPVSEGGNGVECPNAENHIGENCDVNNGCPVVGVEFNFRASDQWIDDITEYNFSIEGVVGSRSGKFPNNFSTIAMVPGLCPACYRSQGIDWNLWGQPTLLDAPENLDLYSMAKSGGTDDETLAALDAEMNKSDINGRLMLVVENKSKGEGSREEYENINGYLEKEKGIDESQVVGSSVFEINFNRICPMVKLKPNQGQSLRVQVGYPAGVTYEDLVGEGGDIELKAYHFTRCAENDKDHPCPNAKKDGHKWGDDILGVDEITVIPTPYGMVIMCDSFSPFEIVAVKKTDTASKDSDPNTVVVVSDTNGTVEYEKDGKNVEAVGDNGNVKFAANEKKTFTVNPKKGYVVDTVSLGGKQINVENGKFTVENITQNEVLSVTFIPETVQESEKELGATVVANVCTHSNIVKVPDADHQNDIPATCTKDGYALATKCDDCGQTMSEAHVIPAAGHKIDESNSEYYKEGKAAGCTEDGARNFAKCTVCKEILSDSQKIPATGHIFTKYTNGNQTCQGIELKAKCDRCSVTETKVNPAGAVDHKFTVSQGKTEATCTHNAYETFKCIWCDETEIKEYPGTMTQHTPNANGNCTQCNKFMCEDGHTIVATAAKEATCTESGHTAGEQCTVCGYWKVPEEIILPKGHSFNGHTAGSQCTVCGQVMTSDKHTLEDIPDTPATCETQGTKGGKRCKVCGDIVEKPTVVDALGHDWDEASAVWKWSTEGGVSASVTLTCKNDRNHHETFAAEISDYVISKSPTCTEEGNATYTASAAVDGLKLSNVYEITLPMAEHQFGSEPVEIIPATCNHHTEKIYECEVCHLRHTTIEEGELMPHSISPEASKSTPAGCTTDGEIVGICMVCYEEVSEPIAAKGHVWNTTTPVWNWSDDCKACTASLVCESCNEQISVEADVSADVLTAPTCTESGETVYTAKADFDGQEYTDKITVSTDALGHSAKKVEAKAPTATEKGNIAYWYCEKCEKYFKDEALTQEITLEQTVLAATGAEKEPAKPSNPDIPNTVYNDRIAVWFILAGMSSVGIVFTAVAKKRRKSCGR